MRKPLEVELQETEERLEKIRKAEELSDESDMKEAMHNAVRSHEAKIRHLKEALENSK